MCEVEVEIHGLDSLWWARMASDFLEKKKKTHFLGVAWYCLAISHLHQLELKVMKSKLLSTVQIPKRGFRDPEPDENATLPSVLSTCPSDRYP